ncbi:MAG: regulatory protein RecX [Muribaculaceae bacterium]|nr:regulatory protein RecX [Muribaculaceae bacterium]
MCAFIRKTVTPEKALYRLETLCAASEQCSYELYVKLKRWGISAADSEAIMDSLVRRKFVDDSRFAVAYVRDKYRFGRWGRRKIALALSQKRIDRTIINEAMEAIDSGEYVEILAGVMRSKARCIKEGNSFEGRTKLFRSVASRGYETQMIASLISKNEIWGED